MNTPEKDLFKIISSLNEKFRLSIQAPDRAKVALNRVQYGYAGKTMLKKLKAVESLLETKFKNDKDVEDNVVLLELHFSRWASSRSRSEESLNVAILLSSESNLQNFASIIASIKTLQDATATWQYAKTCSMKK